MNLRDLKDRIFQMTGGLYRDQQHMNDLINDALTELATEAKLRSTVQIDMTEGVGEYPLPEDFKEAISLLEGTYDNPISIYNLVDPSDLAGGYAISGDSLILKPTPTVNKSLQFNYYSYLLRMVEETDPLPIDDRYAQTVAAYASAMILSLPTIEGVNEVLIDRYFGIWESGRARFKTDMQRRNKRAAVRKVVNYW